MNTPHSVAPGMLVRWRRIFGSADGRTLILPLDHGITHGVNRTLGATRTLVADGIRGGADALLLRPGLMRAISDLDLHATGLIIALTGRLSGGVDHIDVNSVEEAVRAGADAVAVELKLGSPGELANLRLAARLREEAHLLGLPVLVMVYPVEPYLSRVGSAARVHACRIGEELGADFIKTSQPDEETLQRCLEAITVPLVIAGGGSADEFGSVTERVAAAIATGAAGAAIGRAVFGAADPEAATRRLARAVHGQ